MERKTVLDVKNLVTVFRNESGFTTAVDDVSFSLKEEETLGIVGESGSGKSVTALSILRLIPDPPGKIRSGEILFAKENGTQADLLLMEEKEMRKIRGRDISMIFQEPMTSLNPVFTVGMQVSETILTHLKSTKKEAKERVIDLFSEVRLPDPGKAYASYPHELSGGQKQRVMIAMAMACNPKILIADEPTTALDVTVQKTILELMKELQSKHGMSILFITHDLGLIAGFADHALVMYRGKSVEYGETGNLFRHPKHPYTQGLLNCRPPLDKRLRKLPTIDDFMITAPDTKQTSSDLFSAANIVKTEERTKNHGELYSQPPILEVRNVKTYFPDGYSLFGKILGYSKAVDDVSFDVYPGETLGIVGESGCGKTTLGRTILRLINATSGKVRYNGRNLSELSSGQMQEVRKDLQIIFQDPYSSLNPRISAGSSIMEPMIVHRLFRDNRQRKEKTIELLEKVGLDAGHYNRYPHEFSGGQRQRICIARALAVEPKLIICDESVSALDVSVQAQVLNLLNDLKRNFHFTYLFISHDLSVVRFMSDRLIVMKGGKIEEIGEADTIYSSPQRDYTRRLLEAIPRGIIN
jgi:peptide/nickel transport system ATP-binding protein